jgi:hypothetical protein
MIPMEPGEIERLVTGSLGKTLYVRWQDGHLATVRITSVDQEGFTCYVLDHEDIDPSAEQWLQFDEVVNASPQ